MAQSVGPICRGELERQAESARPLRVLCLINSLGSGGAERSLVELFPRYQAEGIEPVVTCLRRREEGVESAVRSLGLELRYLKGDGFVAWVPEIRRHLRAGSFDLLHTSIFESDVAGRLAAARLDIPVLTSLVNTSYEPIRLSDPNVSRAGLWAARAIDGWTSRWLTTHFHAITHAVKDAAVKALGIRPDRVTVVERGRDPDRLGTADAVRRTKVRQGLGLGPEDEVVLTVGRQEYQKGQRDLIEAFALVAHARPRAQLLLAGRRGNASAELERAYRDLGLDDRVRFLGFREDIPEILASADVFAFPSLYEGQGGALIEAMALGLPVVATRIPSTTEVVEEGRNAVLVPVRSPAALASAITGLLADPNQMGALGQRSAEIFRERFTLERSADRMISLYRGLVERGRRDGS